jgi:hypothetical protein
MSGREVSEGRGGQRLPRPERKKVLVVLHSDGWVEAYSDKTVDVYITQRLHTEDDASVHLVDEYLERSLPKVYRRLYWPVKLRAVGQCRRVTPEAMLDRRLALDLLAALRQIGGGR